MPTINGSERTNTGLSVQTESTEKARAGEHAGHKVVEVPAFPTAGLSEGSPPDKSLAVRKVEVQTALSNMLSSGVINQQGFERISERGSVSVSLLLETPWMQQRLEAEKPLTDSELDQLCQAAFELDGQIQKGAPEHTLAWRADSMLGEHVDTSSPDQLTDLIRDTVNTLKKQCDAKGSKIPAQIFAQTLARLDGIDEKASPAEQLVAVSQTLKNMHEEFPTLPGSDLLEGLQAHVTDQLQTIVRDEFKGALKTQLESLERGGSKQEIILGFELGAAAAHLVGVNVGVRYTFDASARDDTRIMDRSTVTGSIDLVLGGDHIVRADIGGSLSASKGKLFKNLDNFVDYHANDILPMLLGSAAKAPKNAKGVFKARKSDSTHAQAVADRPQLQQQLIAHGVLKPGDRLTVEDRRRAEFMAVSERSGALKAQLSALDDMLAGKFTISNTHTEFRRHVTVQDAFRSNPELLAKEPDRYFSVHTQGKNLTGPEGQAWMKSTSQLLNNLKAEYTFCAESDPKKAEALKGMIEHVRTDLREAMAALYAEYDHYSAVVNRYDGKGDSGEVQSDLGDLKHRMEKDRGSSGRGEFLRGVSATHSRLSQIYENSFSLGLPPNLEDKEAGKLFSRMEAEYRMPQIHLTDKQVKGSLSVQSRNNATQRNSVAELKLKVPYTPLLLSAAVCTEHIDGHFNTDMNGDYLNVSFRVDVGANMQGILGSIQSGLPSVMKSGAGTAFTTSMPTDMTFGLDMGGQVECHFIKGEEGYCLQYLRFSGEKGIGGATPEIPVVAGPWGNVKVKAEAAFLAQTNLKEYVGNNTMTYFFTRYNGWVDGGKASKDIAVMRQAGQGETAGSDYWDQFVHNNTSQIQHMMKNMVTPGKNVAAEFNKRLTEIGDEDFTTNIRTALETYKSDSSEKNYKAALAEFNELMASSHMYAKARQDAAFSFKKK